MAEEETNESKPKMKRLGLSDNEHALIEALRKLNDYELGARIRGMTEAMAQRNFLAAATAANDIASLSVERFQDDFKRTIGGR